MTIEASLIAKWERDGYPLEVVQELNSNPGRSLENIARDWILKQAETTERNENVSQ